SMADNRFASATPPGVRQNSAIDSGFTVFMAKIRSVESGVVIFISEEVADENERSFADPCIAHFIGDIRQRAAYGLAFRPGGFIDHGHRRIRGIPSFDKPLGNPMNALYGEINRHRCLVAGKRFQLLALWYGSAPFKTGDNQ